MEQGLLLTQEPAELDRKDLPVALSRLTSSALRCDALRQAAELVERLDALQPLPPAVDVDREVYAALLAQGEER